MGRYIDIDNYCKNICRCNGNKCNKSKCSILNAPKADVVPRSKLTAAAMVLTNHGIHVEGINA